MSDTASFPDPAERARPGITGTPVVLADGREWLLAAKIPDLAAPVWSSLFDDGLTRESYEWSEIALAAAYLLAANYRVDLDEAHALICGTTDLAPLIPAVEMALFGTGTATETFGGWALASLWSNGLDPDLIPPGMLWPVLNNLVALDRAIPPHRAIKSARAARDRASFEAILAAKGIRRNPAPTPAGEPPAAP